jgi:hypothetical protein
LHQKQNKSRHKNDIFFVTPENYINSELQHVDDKPSILNSSRNPQTVIIDQQSPRDSQTIESGVGAPKDPDFLKDPKNKRIINKLGNRHPIRKQATLPVPTGNVIDELSDFNENDDLSASALSSDQNFSDENQQSKIIRKN